MPRDVSAFKSGYLEFLPCFEAARQCLSERDAIAADLAEGLEQGLVYRRGSDQESLSTCLESETGPLALESVTGNADNPWRFNVEYAHQSWSSLAALGARLVAGQVANRQAGDALQWLANNVLEDDCLDLRGRRIVVMGAAAEMASTRLFLDAGADVLWLDVKPPPAALQRAEVIAGRLVWPPQNADLLAQPAEILATILDYADGDPVDLCLYAYAPGQARELRLAGVMNAIVDALPRSVVGSVTTLVSPTTTAPLNAGDREDRRVRNDNSALWEKWLGVTGVMGRADTADCDDVSVTRTLVGIQGVSYQAAQYLAKLITAENWYNQGLRVSANTAPITRTASMDHPVFDAAFLGARAFQVTTFTPAQSQVISGLLAIRDWLHPDHPVPGQCRVHGGIHTLPYPLNKALRIAALIGFARSPGLLTGLLGR